ncbi:response regulator transcription factor [Phenylobacterium sp. LjRoot219]|uniref:response regulator transcription factor n=1 Tax=Phenylobacterium sp. LjRoot219 TaxID=3342283 RepID=UPI003ED0358F
MRILLIDDDDTFTAMMAEYLESEGFACERAHDPLGGLERALSGRFDAVVLDVMMPQLDGMELLRRLRRQSALPVVMLTAKGDSIDRVVGLELGADDYLPKPVYPRELVARLRAVLRRVQSDPPAANDKSELAIGPLRIAPAKREAWLRERLLVLTGTEFDLLLQLARLPGDAITKDELSERALRRPREPYDRSVDVHISNLRQKLGAAGGGVEIETVRAIGYRLRAPA